MSGFPVRKRDKQERPSRHLSETFALHNQARSTIMELGVATSHVRDLKTIADSDDIFPNLQGMLKTA